MNYSDFKLLFVKRNGLSKYITDQTYSCLSDFKSWTKENFEKNKIRNCLKRD